jgi:hypothetical protein
MDIRLFISISAKKGLTPQPCPCALLWSDVQHDKQDVRKSQKADFVSVGLGCRIGPVDQFRFLSFHKFKIEAQALCQRALISTAGTVGGPQWIGKLQLVEP